MQLTFSIVMQAMAVLLLEMAYMGKDMVKDDHSLGYSIKKLIRWLRVMRNHDQVAFKAYKITQNILETCAPSLSDQVKDILATDKDDDTQYTYPAQTSRGASKPEPHRGFPCGRSEQEIHNQQMFDPLSEPPPYNFTGGYPVSAAQYGTAFFTPFDQGVPVVNMDSLWAPMNLDSGFANVDFPISDTQQSDVFDPTMYTTQDPSNEPIWPPE